MVNLGEKFGFIFTTQKKGEKSNLSGMNKNENIRSIVKSENWLTT